MTRVRVGRGIGLVAVAWLSLLSAVVHAQADENTDPIGQTEASVPGGSIPAAIEAYTRALDEADRDARMAAFATAERLFARALEAGVRNADLYANLGNAALQAERIGPAILAYRRALELDPAHPRALQNLAYARESLPEWVPRPETGGLSDSFFFWHRRLSRGARETSAALAFFVTLALLAIGIRLDRAGVRQLALVPGIAWIAIGASFVLDPARAAEREVVITAPEAVARAADSALAPTLFSAPLPGGTEATIVDLRSPWAQIRLANGRDAWVAESRLERVRPEG